MGAGMEKLKRQIDFNPTPFIRDKGCGFDRTLTFSTLTDRALVLRSPIFFCLFYVTFLSVLLDYS